jgi:hypothetical protein
MIHINRLPPEVLGEIFSQCLPQHPSFSPTDAPLILTQICQKWRSTALNTPHLWSSFTIPDWQSLFPGILQLAELWISRSRDTPLDVSIDVFSQEDQIWKLFPGTNDTIRDELYDFLRRLLDILAPHHSRICHFHCTLPDSLMKSVRVNEMTNLETLVYKSDRRLERSFDVEERLAPEEEILDIGPPKQMLKTFSASYCAIRLDSILHQTQLEHIELLELRKGGNLNQEMAFQIFLTSKSASWIYQNQIGIPGLHPRNAPSCPISSYSS